MAPPNLRPLPTMSPDAIPVMPGSRLAGRYRVLHHVESVATGVVLMALDETSGGRLMVKLLAPIRGSNPEEPFGERTLRRAARKAQRIQHPGLVTIHDVFVERIGDADVVGLVMERCAAPRLDLLLGERGPLPWMEAVEILDGVAAAIQAAHAQGTQHLGLRPGKIYVDPPIADVPRGALVTGVGLLPAIRDLRRPSRIPGDPRWFAPEVLGDGPVDARADVWSLGKILEVLLTGDAEGRTPIALVDTDLPKPLVTLVRTSLEAEPGRRPPSVEMFRRDLARIADPGAETPAVVVPAARAPSSPRPSVLPVLAGLGAAGVVGGILVGLAVAVLVGWIQVGEAPAASRPVVLGEPVPIVRTSTPPTPVTPEDTPPPTVAALSAPIGALPDPGLPTPSAAAPVSPAPAPVAESSLSVLPDPPSAPPPVAKPAPPRPPRPKVFGSLTSVDQRVGLVFEQAARQNGGECLKLTVRNLGEAPLVRWSIDIELAARVQLTGASGFSPFGETTVRLVPDAETLGPLQAYSGTLCANPLPKPILLNWRASEGG